MTVFFMRWRDRRISGAQHHRLLTADVHDPDARDYVQDLTRGMTVPCSLRTRCEGNQLHTQIRAFAGCGQMTDPSLPIKSTRKLLVAADRGCLIRCYLHKDRYSR